MKDLFLGAILAIVIVGSAQKWIPVVFIIPDMPQARAQVIVR